MFQTRIVEKIKHTFGSSTTSPKLVPFITKKKWKIYDAAKHTTDENIIRSTKDKRMHTVIFNTTAFPLQQ